MRALTLPLLLAVSLMTPACSLTIPMTARPSVAAEQQIVKRICTEAWLPVEYDSEHDTVETVEGNRANNRSREAFCK